MQIKYLYYNSTDRSSAGIVCFKHDKENFESGNKTTKIGVLNLKYFEKYEVDILGNYHRVKKETRKGGKNNVGNAQERNR